MKFRVRVVATVQMRNSITDKGIIQAIWNRVESKATNQELENIKELVKKGVAFRKAVKKQGLMCEYDIDKKHIEQVIFKKTEERKQDFIPRPKN